MEITNENTKEQANFQEILQYLSKNLSTINEVSQLYSLNNITARKQQLFEQINIPVLYEKRIEELEALVNSYKAKFQYELGTTSILPHNDNLYKCVNASSFDDKTEKEEEEENNFDNEASTIKITQKDINRLEIVLKRLREYNDFLNSKEFLAFRTAFASFGSLNDTSNLILNQEKNETIEAIGSFTFVEMLEHLERITPLLSRDDLVRISSAGLIKKIVDFVKIFSSDTQFTTNANAILFRNSKEPLKLEVENSFSLKRRNLYEDIEFCMPASDDSLEITLENKKILPALTKNIKLNTNEAISSQLSQENIDSNIEIESLRKWSNSLTNQIMESNSTASAWKERTAKEIQIKKKIILPGEFDTLAKNKTLLAALKRLMFGDFFQSHFNSITSILSKLQSLMTTCEVTHRIMIETQNDYKRLKSMKEELNHWNSEIDEIMGNMEYMSKTIKKSVEKCTNQLN